MIELNPLPSERWLHQAPNGDIHLCDSVDGQPLRGYGLDHDPTRPPMAFEEDRYGFQEGRRFWQNADEESNGQVEVAILLTDPSRPDGLGNPKEFKKFAQQYDIIGRTAARGVVFATQQHGLGERAPGLRLDDNTSHPEYDGQLQDVLDTLGTPNFSFTPSIRSGLMVPSDSSTPVAPTPRILQRGREMVYDVAGEQEDLQHPDNTLYAADMVHTNELGHAMLSTAGVRLLEHIDNDDVDIRPFPNNILLIAPGEYGNLQEQLEAAMGVSPDEVVQTGTTVPDAVQKGSDFYWYAQAKSMGYIPEGALR